MSGNSERIEVGEPYFVATCPRCFVKQRKYIDWVDMKMRKVVVKCIGCKYYYVQHFIMTDRRDRNNGKESTVPVWEASRGL